MVVDGQGGEEMVVAGQGGEVVVEGGDRPSISRPVRASSVLRTNGGASAGCAVRGGRIEQTNVLPASHGPCPSAGDLPTHMLSISRRVLPELVRDVQRIQTVSRRVAW